jgi:hypothetical protein
MDVYPYATFADNCTATTATYVINIRVVDCDSNFTPTGYEDPFELAKLRAARAAAYWKSFSVQKRIKKRFKPKRVMVARQVILPRTLMSRAQVHRQKRKIRLQA